MNTRLLNIGRDLTAGMVVYLVALPLCLGIALASNAPMVSGLLAGMIGGIVIGAISGSHTSVSGPAAGLTAVVASQIATLGSFDAFLVAVALAGVMQIVLGVMRAGLIASFFPSSVIKGLLAAIGIILVLKQLPHVFGHDADVEGEMQFVQPDHQNTFSELLQTIGNIHAGAALIGLFSVALLLLWDRIKLLKQSPVPAPLIVVLVGTAANTLFAGLDWEVTGNHLVQVPIISSLSDASNLLVFPDWTQLAAPAVYIAAFTIAIVASLETLLNLDAVDQLDPEQRKSPPNRELIAQGAGNMLAGFLGGLPITSVVVRGSININAGAKTRLSTIFHGILLLTSVALIPELLNRIPLSALAAILLVTGLKLAAPKLFKQMWQGGREQFLPFMVTITVIVFTDLLIGVLVGLGVAIIFILNSNMRRPLRKFHEKHVSGDVLRIELANQVSFFNKGTLERTLYEVPRGGHVLIDARSTDYIAPDILDLLRDFRETTAPAHGVELSLVGFRDNYPMLEDRVRYVDYTTREVRSVLTPDAVLDILKQGNQRFRQGEQLTRDLVRQIDATAVEANPFALVLSCMDSRAPVELLFDLGIGDVFTVRIAGNVAPQKVLGSIEYACVVAGAKLIVVMGHSSCGAVTATLTLTENDTTALASHGCENIDVVAEEIRNSIDPARLPAPSDPELREKLIDDIAHRNVQRTIDVIRKNSTAIEGLIATNQLKIIGAFYDVKTGEVEFF